MFNKKIGLLLVAVFSSMMLIIACSSDTTVDNKKHDNTITNPDGNSGNSGGNGGNGGDSGGDSGSGGGSDGDNGNNGNGNTDNEKPLPPKSHITLECTGEYYTNTPFTLEVKTDDNRELNEITWKEVYNDPNIQINNYGKTAEITATQPNSYGINVVESNTNYSSQCYFQVIEPQLIPDSYSYSFIPGERKTINFRFTPDKFNQGVKIENEPEGYEFNIQSNYIEVESLKEQGTVQIVLVSNDKKIRSLPISLSSSNDYTFKVNKTTDTNFNDNLQKTFIVKVTKGSKHTSYRLEENLPGWIHYEKKQVSDLEDQYTFTIDENDRIMHRAHEVVFLPGNATNTQDKKAQKFTVKQDRNFIPKDPTIVFFKGASPDNQEKYSDIDYANQHYKKNIPGIFLYENNFKGWYNANKIVGNERLKSKDSNMCWMYTAVNAIHWWVEHNKKEIEKYMAFKKPETTDKDKYDKGYYKTDYKPAIKGTINLSSDSAKMKEREDKSDVAKLFREVFKGKNTGGHPDKALLWYLAGIRYENNEHQIFVDGFGMFKDIFLNKTSALLRDIRLDQMTYEKFNNVIKQAKDNDRILFTNVRYDSGALHAINIWGYVVDKYGDVFEVYVADNNLPSSSDSNLNSDDDLSSMPLTGNPSNSYLIKRGIDIDSNGNVRLEDLQGRRGSGPILNLFHELDLGKQYFEEYFKNNGIN